MKINALILAGGQGSRMGGADKGLVLWQGRAFVDYVIDCIRPQVAHIAIVGDGDFGDVAASTAAAAPESRSVSTPPAQTLAEIGSGWPAQALSRCRAAASSACPRIFSGLMGA